MQVSAPDESAMIRVAAEWIKTIECPAFVYLSGDLGAGKSTFVRAAIRALGYSGTVKSPTFSLLESYSVEGQTIYHLDLYRLVDPQELEFIGFRDLLSDAQYMFIEWPEQAEDYLPDPTHKIQINYQGDGRQLIIVNQHD